MAADARHKKEPRQDRVCLSCNKTFSVQMGEIRKGGGKYCSRKCSTTRVWRNCLICDKRFFEIPSRIKKGLGKYCGRACYYESRIGVISKLKGVKRPTRAGANCVWWKGGITPLREAIRSSLEYEQWRTAVLERDLYTCQHCGQVGGKLEVDHIKPFALYDDLRLDIDNGRTLCRPCHINTPAHGVNLKYMKERNNY